MLIRLLKSGVLLLLMLSISIGLIYLDYRQFLETPIQQNNPVVIDIQEGMHFKDVGEKIVELGLIEDTYYFEFLARFSGLATRLKSGEYEISPGLTPEDLLKTLASGKVIQYPFTILEGWQIRELLEAIKTNKKIINTLGSHAPETLMTELGYSETSPEGLFFPDTYHFPKGTTDIGFLKRAYERLQLVLAEEWLGKAENLPYKTPYDALIMASIIEKETGLASERKTIAGVFVRRLNRGMKLQTDPTVIFAMGNQFNGNIRKKDLHIDSPYNTYRHQGLPPGPIALVGREAMHAALNPEDGKTLFFVSRGDGSHYFSETLQEHNQAVATYQLNRRQKNE